MSPNALSTPARASRSRLAEYLTKRLDALALNKNEQQIANELGYRNANIIIMFKKGNTKVPLEKVPALARALDTDPAFLFRLAMEQFWPGDDNALQEIFGRTPSANEMLILDYLRELGGGTVQEFTEELKRKLRQVFEG